jgi:hypothetical protein
MPIILYLFSFRKKSRLRKKLSKQYEAENGEENGAFGNDAKEIDLIISSDTVGE